MKDNKIKTDVDAKRNEGVISRENAEDEKEAGSF